MRNEQMMLGMKEWAYFAKRQQNKSWCGEAFTKEYFSHYFGAKYHVYTLVFA